MTALAPPRGDAPADLLAGMARGFANPVRDTQVVFRHVLMATSRPGRVQRLPESVTASLAQAAPWCAGVTALLLTLLDGDTSLHLTARCASARGAAFLRFHTGVREADAAATADFVVAEASELDARTLQALALGSDESPQQGATLIVACESLAGRDRDGAAAGSGPSLRLTGPGIEHRVLLQVGGIPVPFWRARIAQEADFPRGADLLLVCGGSVVGLPRSTRLTLLED